MVQSAERKAVPPSNGGYSESVDYTSGGVNTFCRDEAYSKCFFSKDVRTFQLPAERKIAQGVVHLTDAVLSLRRRECVHGYLGDLGCYVRVNVIGVDRIIDVSSGIHRTQVVWMVHRERIETTLCR